jgi:putative DNA primase/helicase
VGSIQIDRLQYYLDEALGGGHGGDGMVQRFQLLVKIVHLGEWKPPTSWPDSQAKQRAFEAFRWLDESDLSVLGRQDFDEDVPYVRFSHEAQEMAEQWHKELEDRLRGPEFQGMPAFEAHIGKYRSLMPSLALIFQLLDYAVSAVSPISKEYAPEKFSVSLEAAALAIDWCDFLEKHARAIYQAEITPGVEAANKLADKINEGRIHHGEPVRDIYRHGWSGLRTSAVVLSGLEVLESAGWIRQVSQQTGNTTTILLYLHPKLREASNG